MRTRIHPKHIPRGCHARCNSTKCKINSGLPKQSCEDVFDVFRAHQIKMRRQFQTTLFRYKLRMMMNGSHKFDL